MEPPTSRPDTQIKLFCDTGVAALREIKENHSSSDGWTVLRQDEPASSNSFSRPYPFIAIRQIPSHEALPDDLKHDGDSMSDYFDTLRSLRRDNKGESIGHVFMGFKAGKR